MYKKIWSSLIHRGSPAVFALGIGFLAGGSQKLYTLIVGGIFILIGIGIVYYNWEHPIDDNIPSRAEAIKNSKVVWGFWHTGEKAKQYFKLGSVKRVLLIEPNPDSNSFRHLLNQSGELEKDILANIFLTTEEAINRRIEVRWHDDPTVLSFMICDPTPGIDKNNLVTFSKNAYVVVQVADRNLIQPDWSFYKKTNAKDPYAFNAYVKWFKDVWDNKSKEGLARPIS